MLAEQPQGHVTTPIMPARLLCWGSGQEKIPLCAVCVYRKMPKYMRLSCHRARFVADRKLRETHMSALRRVYARESCVAEAVKLRKLVEALEWLREVEQIHYAVFWTKEAKQEWRVTLAHASKEAGV